MKRSMMQAYIKNSAHAIPFYRDAFGAKVVCCHHNTDGTIAHAELDIYGQIFSFSESEQKEPITGNTMQFCLHFGAGNEELVQKIIDNLSDGGKIVFSEPVDWSPLVAGIIDKFNVNWCIFV